MDHSQQTSNTQELALKAGIFFALIKILMSTLHMKFFIGNFSLNIALTIVSVLIGLIILIWVALEARKLQGGFITMKEIFKPIFITILIGTSLSYAFDLLYVHVLDPSVYDQLKQSTIDFAQRFGAEDAALDEIAVKFDEEQARALTPGRIILGLFQVIILHSIAGFIIGAIFKRRRPAFMA